MSNKKKIREYMPSGIIPSFIYLVKWLLICSIIGLLAGSASVIFLLMLEWATKTREANLWLVALLPVGGLIIGLVYHYFGKSVVKGNNQILEEFHSPKAIIPLKWLP